MATGETRTTIQRLEIRMSKAPWEMTPSEIKTGMGEAPPPAPEQPKQAPWEMAWKAVRAFFVPEAPKVAPAPKKPAVAPSKGFDMDSYLRTTAQVESSNNPRAKASTSSATGLYQFTAGTWNDVTNKMNVTYTLADRKDPVKSEEVMREFTKRNVERAREDLGREPTHLDAYMYHFLGRSAPKVLQADEKAIAASLVTKAQAKANKSVFFDKDGRARTVKEVLDRYREKGFQ